MREPHHDEDVVLRAQRCSLTEPAGIETPLTQSVVNYRAAWLCARYAFVLGGVFTPLFVGAGRASPVSSTNRVSHSWSFTFAREILKAGCGAPRAIRPAC